MAVDDEDIERIGKAVYAKIRPRMESEHWGRIVVIDVHSGDYEIADDDLTATLRIFERHPDALTWAERVGYPAPYYVTERIRGGL